jgi:hypothetical protein
VSTVEETGLESPREARGHGSDITSCEQRGPADVGRDILQTMKMG